jgi:hypothetical protein
MNKHHATLTLSNRPACAGTFTTPQDGKCGSCGRPATSTNTKGQMRRHLRQEDLVSKPAPAQRPVGATRLENLTFDLKHAKENMEKFEMLKTLEGWDGTPNADNPQFWVDFEEVVAELAEAKAALEAHS